MKGSFPQRAAGVAALLLVMCTTAPAWAYVDTGYDPDDRIFVGFDPDIRSTTRRLSIVGGERTLWIVVRSYENFGRFWGIVVRLDTRGGPRQDFKMRIANADLEGKGCWVFRPGEFSDRVTGAFHQHGDRAACRIPAREVRPNKRILWRLISRSGHAGGNTDYAPDDQSWYGA